MKTLKLIALVLVVTSVSFAQTKREKTREKTRETKKVVAPLTTKTTPAPVITATPAPTKPAVPQTPSQLKWEKEIHDFGTIEQNKPQSYEFTFTNTTNKDVLLTNVKASCGCTAANYTKTAIKPGEKGFVTATYNAAAGGSFHKTITVTSSEENSAAKIITIKGTVQVATPPATVTPESK